MIRSERAVLDVLQITQLIAKYAHLLDAGLAEEFSELWCEDAEYLIENAPEMPEPLKGKRAVLDFMAVPLANNAAIGKRMDPSVAQPRHSFSNIMFETLSEHRATTATFLQVTRTNIEGTTLGRTGVYYDEFRRDGGQWRFLRRRLQLDGAPFSMPAPVADST